MVPEGQGILATVPCLVLGQVMSTVTRGLQYSTLMFGSFEDGGAPSLYSGSKASMSVWTGATIEDVVCGHWTTAVVVDGILVVVVRVNVDVRVTVELWAGVLAVEVVVSMYIITEEVSDEQKKDG